MSDDQTVLLSYPETILHVPANTEERFITLEWPATSETVSFPIVHDEQLAIISRNLYDGQVVVPRELVSNDSETIKLLNERLEYMTRREEERLGIAPCANCNGIGSVDNQWCAACGGAGKIDADGNATVSDTAMSYIQSLQTTINDLNDERVEYQTNIMKLSMQLNDATIRLNGIAHANYMYRTGQIDAAARDDMIDLIVNAVAKNDQKIEGYGENDRSERFSYVYEQIGIAELFSSQIEDDDSEVKMALDSILSALRELTDKVR